MARGSRCRPCLPVGRGKVDGAGMSAGWMGKPSSCKAVRRKRRNRQPKSPGAGAAQFGLTATPAFFVFPIGSLLHALVDDERLRTGRALELRRPLLPLGVE